MGREYQPAIEMFVNRDRVFQNAQPRGAIVIHKTAGGTSASGIAEYFASTPLEVSSHFVVGLEGEVVQCVSLIDGAAANCCLETGHDSFWDRYGGVNLNLVTISIEHVDSSVDNSSFPPTAQLEASFKLVSWLCRTYGIKDIKTHASISPGSRARCPGNYPMDELIKYVQEGHVAGVPDGWKDDGNTLNAGGHSVVKGFRSYILEHDWDPGDTPLEEEHASNPLEFSNPNLRPGTSQTFKDSRLEWNDQLGVFKGWLGQEYLWLYQSYHQQLALVSQLNEQIAKLKAGTDRALLDRVRSEIAALEKDLNQL